jgi:hypothetical protein
MKKKYLYAKDEHNRITEIHEATIENLEKYGYYIHGEYEESLVSKLNLGFDSIVNDQLVTIGFVESELKEISLSEKVSRIQYLKQLLLESDWKVIVNSELIQAGLQPKYANLHAERQTWRDEINKLEFEITMLG